MSQLGRLNQAVFGGNFARWPEVTRSPLIRAKRRYRKMREFTQMKGGPVDQDNPRMFTEKLMLRILEDHPIPYFELTENKLTAPWYALAKTTRPLRIPRCHGFWRSPTVDDLAGLPESFVLKSTHGSGAVRIIGDRSRDDVGRALDELIAFNHALRGPDGRRLNAFVMAEELLIGSDGGVPSDLKFHCFHRSDGSFEWLLHIVTARFGDTRHDIFDSTLERPGWHFKTDRSSDGPVELPANIDDFITVARDLSSDFDYIRIDLYDVDGGVVFGEFTPTAYNANDWITPREHEFTVGALWDRDPFGHVDPTAPVDGGSL